MASNSSRSPSPSPFCALLGSRVLHAVIVEFSGKRIYPSPTFFYYDYYLFPFSFILGGCGEESLNISIVLMLLLMLSVFLV